VFTVLAVLIVDMAYLNHWPSIVSVLIAMMLPNLGFFPISDLSKCGHVGTPILAPHSTSLESLFLHYQFNASGLTTIEEVQGSSDDCSPRAFAVATRP
jgi:hypothetical protein